MPTTEATKEVVRVIIVVVVIIDTITIEVVLGFSDHILLNMSDLGCKSFFFSLQSFPV